MQIAYAKGARTFERHIDIDDDGLPVSPYCSLPAQIDSWFKAFKRAKTMCGGSGETRRNVSDAEAKYLDAWSAASTPSATCRPATSSITRAWTRTSTSPSRCKRARFPAAN